MNAPTERPQKLHRTIREHTKSRLGCFTCKKRKVRCNQSRPICGACSLRGTKCVYPEGTDLVRVRHSPIATAGKAAQCQTPNSDEATSLPSPALTVVAEPLACLPTRTAMDMKLLWFFTANTAKSFVDERYDRNGFGTTMQTVVVQEALDQPFLLKTLFALAGLHMQYLGQRIDDKMILRYRTEAFRDYRSALENATPASMQALLANAVLIEVLPCDMFRDPEMPDLYILDWILLWRGIHSVVSLLGGKAAKKNWKSGTGTLLAREPLRIDGALDAVPVALKRMVESITLSVNDPDYPIAEAYRDALSLLGALYKRLCTDDKYSETIRILTWVTFLPEEFIQATRRKAPRALVIIGHYGCFLKLLQTLWWARGVGDRCIRDIIAYLGPKWHCEMDIPAAVSSVTKNEEVKQILLTAGRDIPIVGLPLLIPGLAEL